jgi:hypothetical protein
VSRLREGHLLPRNLGKVSWLVVAHDDYGGGGATVVRYRQSRGAAWSLAKDLELLGWFTEVRKALMPRYLH